MEQLTTQLSDFIGSIRFPLKFGITDLVEILIISYLAYHIMVWIKNTRAWVLMKGLLVILLFMLLAIVFNMQTIQWIARNVLGFAVTALVVIMQPELRKALEDLGKRNLISSVLPFDTARRENFKMSGRTIQEITKACVVMGRARTGALIVIAQDESLSDYERTGIDVDAIVTSQLLINVFEHNTPLHDGAVIINGNRLTAATCYLPLSDNMELSKDLGTRHRAGVGISEVTDAMTIIVSEETGKISVAYDGNLERNLTAERLTERLSNFVSKVQEDEKKNIKHHIENRIKRKGKKQV